jgi:hypothetical protein
MYGNGAKSLHIGSESHMTEQIDRSEAVPDAINLRSFAKGGVAVVFGASGGIGGALAEALRTVDAFSQVIAISRATAP